MIERIKHSTGLLVVVLLVAGFYVLSLAVVSYAQMPGYSTDTLYTSVTVESVAPSVTNVSVGDGNPITLTEATTTAVTCSGTISAAGGYQDVTSITSTIYRDTATGTPDCSADDNYCYIGTCVTSSGSGTDMHVVCTAYLWFHAESTDASSSWPGTGWACKINANTTGGQGTGTSATQTLYSLVAHSFVPQTISYGSRQASSTYVATTHPATLCYNTGNIIINGNFQASDMTSTSTPSIIDATNQYIALTDFGSPAQLVEGTGSWITVAFGQTVKPTGHAATSNVSTNLYWGLTVPSGTYPGYYTGTNTSTAISAI